MYWHLFKEQEAKEINEQLPSGGEVSCGVPQESVQGVRICKQIKMNLD